MYSGGPPSTWQKSRQFSDPEAGLWMAQNLNGKLASLSEILEETAKKSQANENCASLCGKSEARNNGNRDNPKELWKPTGNNRKIAKTQEIQSRHTQNWQTKLQKAAMETCKTETAKLKKPRKSALEIVTKSVARTDFVATESEALQ